MKKNILLILTAFIFIFGFVTNVEAYCTSRRYSDLKSIAYKSELSYELKFDNKNNHYFQIKVSNVDKNILVMFNGATYEPVNGIVDLQTRLAGGKTYEVQLLGGYETQCIEEYLYTKKITVPTYNVYSERDECIEYEEFPLCNKWYSGYIVDENDFLNRLNEYVISLNKTEKENIPVKEKSFINKLIDFYKDNIVITLPITIIILLFIVYKIVVKIIKRRKRIKLNDK